MRKNLLIAAALGALALSQPILADNRLDGTAIKALLSGATLTGLTSRGDPYEGKLNADGTRWPRGLVP